MAPWPRTDGRAPSPEVTETLDLVSQSPEELDLWDRIENY